MNTRLSRNFKHARPILTAMRVGLLVLMMVLLPLRGWASGAMALDHAPQMPATVMAQSSSGLPCHGPELTHADAHAPDAAHSAAHPTCSLCDVCHSPLLATAQAVVSLAHALPQAHAVAAETFASAPARLLLKPPKT